MRKLLIFSILIGLFGLQYLFPIGGSEGENLKGDNECTILVASGSVTNDGRPIIWKNRDVTNGDQKYLYIPRKYSSTDTTYAFNGNFYANDPTRCYMGINEKGFGLINANCYNLPDNLEDGIDDGDLMRLALETCSNVEEWEGLLDQTNMIGRRDAWIFGAIDASGTAKLYESSNFFYYTYDANDPDNAPDGIIVRTVFAFAGWDTDRGADRYKRAQDLVDARPEEQPMSVEFILQTLARDIYCCQGDPYPLPFYGKLDTLPVGFVDTDESINRFKTRSCSVIRGTLPDEDPLLATTFALLGPPVLSIAVPLWVGSGMVPEYLSAGVHCPWYQVIQERKQELYPIGGNQLWLNTNCLLDSNGLGVYSYSLELEDWALNRVDDRVESWLGKDVSQSEIQQAQDEISEVVWLGFLMGSMHPLDVRGSENVQVLPEKVYHTNYPNPFNISTTIKFDLGQNYNRSSVPIDIYNVLGEKVAELGEVWLNNGLGSVVWDGRNDYGQIVTAGVYFYSIETGGISHTGKMMLLK